MTPSSLLAHIGRSLFGERWPMPLAKAIDRHNRQVWRWINGESVPDREVFLALADILHRRQLELNEAADTLERWLAAPRSPGPAAGRAARLTSRRP